jgi:co-chaperonin GroES (HSP10)
MIKIVYDGTDKNVKTIMYQLGEFRAKEVRKVGNVLIIPVGFGDKRKVIRKAVHIGDTIVFKKWSTEIIKKEKETEISF